MSSHEGLPFYLSSHEGFRETCGSRSCITHICILMFALYKRYVVVAVVLNISAHSICFIQKVSGSRGYITHIRVSTLLLHKVRGSRGCVNHSCVLVFALYKRYVVVAVVSFKHIRAFNLLYTKG